MDDRTFQDVIRHRFESKLANFQRQSILFQVAHGYSQTLQALGQVYGGEVYVVRCHHSHITVVRLNTQKLGDNLQLFITCTTMYDTNWLVVYLPL